MEERNVCLEEIKIMTQGKLKTEMKENRPRYLETCKMLILQSMIKLIEPSLLIMVREEDKGDIEGMISDIEQEYKDFMTEQTDRDEYSCSLSVMDSHYLTEDLDKGCGGIIMFTDNKRIMCKNTLYSRLCLTCEESLPAIRTSLFPSADDKWEK